MRTIRTYSELITIPTYEERFRYLQLNGQVGIETFGFDRWLVETFYHSQKWKHIRNEIIIRDLGCDMACDGYEIHGRIIIHHMNPLLKEDVIDMTEYLTNPDFLVCVTHDTHNAIHYGDSNLLQKAPIERKPNDTCPWRN